jgi:hypothetical protein
VREIGTKQKDRPDPHNVANGSTYYARDFAARRAKGSQARQEARHQQITIDAVRVIE